MNTYLRIRNSLCVLACVALLLPMIGCMREPETALRIGTNVWIGSEPLYLARAGRWSPVATCGVSIGERSPSGISQPGYDGMVISPTATRLAADDFSRGSSWWWTSHLLMWLWAVVACGRCAPQRQIGRGESSAPAPSC
jgi:hypothetical protein